VSVDNSLLLEHLKAIRADTAGMRVELKEIKSRLSTVEIGIAGIRSDLAHNFADYARQQATLDALTERIERIERRLDLVEGP
jgi:uncharacterized coiled-coil protein SlyX